MTRMGIFGGAFDPPHIGHLISAEYAIEELGLERVFFVPSGDHPFKRADVVASAQDRLDMVKLATGRYEKFETLDMEIARQGQSYTIDTLESLHKDHPDWKLFLLIGADNVIDFQQWHRYESIFDVATVAVVERKQHEQWASLESSLKNNLIFLDTPVIDISSTEIRRRLKEGKRTSYLVTHEVEDYIRRRDLYR